ncbi:VOC family protein [Spirosoma pomorum]
MDDLEEYRKFYETLGWSYDDVDDYRKFYETEGYAISGPSDKKLATDVQLAKSIADKDGNTRLSNTLDFILKYGDRALTILTKNGIIKNQNLANAGYTFNVIDDPKTTTPISGAPDPQSRVFNLDFSDPKVLIICFLVIMAVAYFLFSNKAAPAKR